MSSDERQRRRPNQSEKHGLRVAEVAHYMKAAGRKAQKGEEPNDRRYDHSFQKKLRTVSPVELDRLIRDDEAD